MSRLSQMIKNAYEKSGLSEHSIARQHGWSQQTLHSWITGVVPRERFHESLSGFLRISIDELKMLADEAKEGATSKKIPKLDLVYGKVSDRKDGKWSFPEVGGKRFPLTQYCIRVDTKVMEPAFIFGCKAWVDPSRWPQPGNDVMVHTTNGQAWIGQLVGINNDEATIRQHSAADTIEVSGISAVHVIILAERVAG